jgi:hypothetical protein
MEVNNPGIQNRILTDDGSIVHIKIIPWSHWNMDTTAVFSVAHGMGAKWLKIIGIFVHLTDNSVTNFSPLMAFNNNADPSLIPAGIGNITNTDITLARRTGGAFDGATYNDASGVAVILYIE